MTSVFSSNVKEKSVNEYNLISKMLVIFCNLIQLVFLRPYLRLFLKRDNGFVGYLTLLIASLKVEELTAIIYSPYSFHFQLCAD